MRRARSLNQFCAHCSRTFADHIYRPHPNLGKLSIMAPACPSGVGWFAPTRYIRRSRSELALNPAGRVAAALAETRATNRALRTMGRTVGTP